ncbi:MAG: 7-cyano-7-deazaguanine synthase QueC [Alphaproteobacteria bacterium RIFCSPHIGHO2_12_FULL_63_12]|nr:MAG: 7-cyano-7-deazaguanine synthase QueC [Alphaproteobacteria bacterium RIFCSPHIGHO2_12_FULL_63_12]
MRRLSPSSALVLFSGGQDSSIALVWALTRFERVETIAFDYGQRHQVELAARVAVRREIAQRFLSFAPRLGDDAVIDLSGLGAISETALTRQAEIVIGETGLPTTFVPGRNLVFLTMAAAYAYRRSAGVIVAGMCEADFSGYPDCRRAALDAQMQAIALGMEAEFSLETPLMHLTKAQSWFLAEELGGKDLVDLLIEHTHSCYLGDRATRFDWGYGCGLCPACELRANGWAGYVAARSRREIR